MSGLPYFYTETEINGLFAPYGEILFINLRTKISEKQKGVCFVHYDDQWAPKWAADNLNGLQVSICDLDW